MDFKSAHEGFIGPINKKSAQGAFFVSDNQSKENPVYSLSDFSEYPAHWLGDFTARHWHPLSGSGQCQHHQYTRYSNLRNHLVME